MAEVVTWYAWHSKLLISMVPGLDASTDGFGGTVTHATRFAALREKGVRLLYAEPRRGTADSRINFVHPRDAGGVLVELVEPAAAAAH